MRSLLTIGLAMVCAGVAAAELPAYSCQIEHAYRLGDDFGLTPVPFVVRRPFSVDRSTGTIIDSGGIFTNTLDDSVVVLEGGNSFQVYWTRPGSFDTMYYFSIGGRQVDRKKGFYALVKNWILTGHCL